MSGTGAPIVQAQAQGKKIAIVCSSWHQEVMDGLKNGAVKACVEAGAEYKVITVPGSFELPLACKKAMKEYDAAVALGVVIRGGTPHFDYVCDGATYGLMKVSLEMEKPIGFGVLTCDNEEQALARAGLANSVEDKGYEAAMAALAML